MYTPAGFGLFIPSYALTVVYFVMLVSKRSFNTRIESLFPLFLFLILFLISAYALNRQMVIFETATPWFAALQGGKEFSVINVTTNDQQQLLHEIRQLFQKSIL